MKNGTISDAGKLRDGELELINRHTRRKFGENEIYAFSLTLCDNDIDRDFERFSDDALDKMAPLFVGKTGIFDHSMKSENQKARIFSCEAQFVQGEKTSDGRPYKKLAARAYMLRSKSNEDLIAEIDAGIKKEVSVGCSMASRTCSVCGKSRKAGCEHRPGSIVKSGAADIVCHTVLSEPLDAYEWSFVAVPAQKKAGVTKSFKQLKEEQTLDTEQIIKSLGNGEGLTLSDSEAALLKSYITGLSQLSELGKSFIADRQSAVVKRYTQLLPNISCETIKSVVEKMSAAELDAFLRAAECGTEKHTEVQLKPIAEKTADSNNGFIIK